MLLLDGKVARDFYAQILSAKIRTLGFSPTLAIIQVGDNPSSTTYIKQKKNFAEKIGATVEHIQFSADVSFEEIKTKIHLLNGNSHIHGIIVQLPLSENLDKMSVINLILPSKDVDGLAKNTKFVPATARGIKALLDFYHIEVAGKKVAMLGRSTLVGAPTAYLLENSGACVIVCHSKTTDTRDITRDSDIIVVAIGKSKLIDESYIGENRPVVIDVGIHTADGKTCGDVDFEKVSPLVSAITPVPGGVGPMTVISLFENLVLAAEKA